MISSLMNRFYSKDSCKKHYKMGKTLGTGSFATVRLAESIEDASLWAVKCIKKSSLSREDEEGLKMEVDILHSVQHPNIVKLREVFDTPSTFYMVMEVMSGGELFDRIVEKEKYSEREAAGVMRQMCEALVYCHKRGIAHRDLKPENLLYASKDDDATLKIADFGLAKLLSEESMLMHTQCGTPGYVAPEILRGKPYSEAVDMWSVGIILYILLCGFPPFYDENNTALFAAIKAGSYDYPSPWWDAVSTEAKDLIDKLLVTDPRRRLTAQAVLDHPWMQGSASDASLRGALSELRKFNARRKFRAGVLAAGAIAKLARPDPASAGGGGGGGGGGR